MRRRLFSVCSAVSLLLCMATCAQWARSYWRSDYVGRTDASGWVGALSMSGIVRLERGNYAANEQGWQFISDAPQSLRREVEARDRAGGRILHSLGFAYARIDYGGGWIRHAFYAPHWSVVLILAAAPAAWVFARLRNSNRAKTGQCRVCGYDLRATPDRCPECGASD